MNAGQSSRAAAGGTKLASAGESAKEAADDVLDEGGGQARPHSREQLRQPERRQRVPGVLRPPQAGERVLHVSGLEKAEPTELHEGDVATTELDLQRVAVVRGPEQDRLLSQGDPGLAPFEDARDDVFDLGELVGDGGQNRPRAARARREEALFVTLGRQRQHSLAASRMGAVER